MPVRFPLGATVLLLLAGCAIEVDDSVAWSTRDQSVLGADQPRISVEPAPSTPLDTPEAVGSDAEAAAVSLLVSALDSNDALLRANAIEALQYAPSHLGDAVRRGLADDNRGVRFVSAMIVGEQRLGEVAILLEPMLHDPSPSVRAAAIYGLARNGRRVDRDPLARMIASDDPEVKANAALVLGELGDPSAIPLLRHHVGRGMTLVNPDRVRIVDLQIAEALVKLGEKREIEGIRAALFAPPEQGEITALACTICGRLGDGRVVSNLVDLATRTGKWQRSPEVRMAATLAVAEIDPRRAPGDVPRAYIGHAVPAVRAQAALTLGTIGNRADRAAVAGLMRDPAPIVQVAAAAAILRIARG